MAEEEKTAIKLESWLLIGFVVAMLLSTSLIVITSFGKQTVFSAYIEDADQNIQYQQVSKMRGDLGEDADGMDYDIANTMSTPMLVNDWREPHRTMLVIAAPEKPFDNAEANAIYEFVTEKGGKVILAANSTNAQTVANMFGVKYFDSPIADGSRYYEVSDSTGTVQPKDISRLWTVAGVNRVWDDQNERRSQCSEDDVRNDEVDDCAMPVLFHRPTSIQVLEEDVENRDVKILAHASPSAFLAKNSMDPNDIGNPPQGGNNSGLIIRMDFPGIEAIDRVKGDRDGTVNVIGSIVFISDHSVLANHLWDAGDAELTGKLQCTHSVYESEGTACWSDILYSSSGSQDWVGNGMYFMALMRDMMETGNPDISKTITRHNENFYIVFDESRHVTSAAASPFTEAMGAIVMLTSDTMLKWLITLNLVALLSIAIMVVPEKENWRHVFDLTRFRERPNKVDPSQFLARIRESLLNKVRQVSDLTRDEMALKTPGEIQALVEDPRLIELLYSQQRSYSNEELRQTMQQIRRWGK